jgi:hypothetical protein
MAAYDSVEQARVLQFKANVTHLYQQTPAKLRGTFREESLTGKAHFFERLGTEAAVLKSARHADTVLLDPAHTRRMVVPADYVWNALVDQQDKIRLLIDPNSEYAIAAAAALRRAQDDVYIAAFTADAATGESGGTAVAFGSDSAAGDVDVSAAAVTTVNILAIKKALDNGDVPAEERYAAVMPSVITQLLANTTAPIAASSDYNTIKALVMGELDTWCGFKWITTTRCPLAAGTDFYTFFWQKQAMGAAIAKEIMARLSERADKDYATQSYACMTIGATRIQGPGVYRLRIDNAL